MEVVGKKYRRQKEGWGSWTAMQYYWKQQWQQRHLKKALAISFSIWKWRIGGAFGRRVGDDVIGEAFRWQRQQRREGMREKERTEGVD